MKIEIALAEPHEDADIADMDQLEHMLHDSELHPQISEKKKLDGRKGDLTTVIALVSLGMSGVSMFCTVLSTVLAWSRWRDDRKPKPARCELAIDLGGGKKTMRVELPSDEGERILEQIRGSEQVGDVRLVLKR